MGPRIIPHFQQFWASLATIHSFQNVSAQYTSRRNKLPFWLLTIVSTIELALTLLVMIAGLLICLSPLFIAASLWGPGGLILTMAAGVMLMAGAGLASERKRRR